MPDYLKPSDEHLMYLRKSRADQEAEARGEGETLARHEAMLLALAARNGHYIPPENIYREIVSGELIADRPEIQRVLSRIKGKKTKGVYVMELERLARGDTIDQGTIAQAFKYSETKIITPVKTYDPDNPFDEEYFEFGLFMSRREYKTINRRIQGGRLQSVREGKFIGSRAPYGYRKVKLKREKGYSLEIHEQEAQIVRSIFDWYVSGRNGQEMGIASIAHLLHDMGVPLGDNGTQWQQCRIYRMLTNEVYTGMIRWGHDKTVRELTDTGIEKRRVVTSEYQLHKGLHQPIISMEIFDAAQALLRDHGKIPVNKISEMSNPLSRIVYCAECGKAMLGNPGFDRIAPYIKCRTRGCPTVQTAREPVENVILETLKYWLHTCDMGGEIILPSDHGHDTSVNQAALVSLHGELESLKKQREKLFDLVEQGTYTKELFNERYAILSEKISSVESSIKLNEAEIQNSPAYKTGAELAPHLRTVLEAYHSAPNARAKNDLLKTVLSRVEYSKSVRGIPGVPSDLFTLKIFPSLK